MLAKLPLHVCFSCYCNFFRCCKNVHLHGFRVQISVPRWNISAGWFILVAIIYVLFFFTLTILVNTENLVHTWIITARSHLHDRIAFPPLWFLKSCLFPWCAGSHSSFSCKRNDATSPSHEWCLSVTTIRGLCLRATQALYDGMLVIVTKYCCRNAGCWSLRYNPMLRVFWTSVDDKPVASQAQSGVIVNSF